MSDEHSRGPSGLPQVQRAEDRGPSSASGSSTPGPSGSGAAKPTTSGSVAGAAARFGRELIIIVVVALLASALLRAFVMQAFFVPTGSMLPGIHPDDRIVVSRIGDLDRGEVVVFEDPGGWIPAAEQAPPPGPVRKALEWVGVLPSSGHEHLVKRLIGLPGDRVVCCVKGKVTINSTPVDESEFLAEGSKAADNVEFDVVVPADHIFVLGDNRYVSGDSSRHLSGQDAFIPISLVTGRAVAVIWPAGNADLLGIPDAYDDVPDGRTPPRKGVVNSVRPGLR